MVVCMVVTKAGELLQMPMCFQVIRRVIYSAFITARSPRPL